MKKPSNSQAITITGIKQKRFDIIDKAHIKAKAATQVKEDKAIFDAIWRATIPKGVVVVTDEESLGRAFDPEAITVETLKWQTTPS
jgi:hypothetical protein